MSRLVERLRWRIVEVLDKLPGQCWADLVSWAYDGPRRKGWRPSQPINSMCRQGYAETGSCYCGKLRAPDDIEDGVS